MSDSPTLDKLVAVSPRFARSISLVRDARRTDALEGYILTPTGRDVLRQIGVCPVHRTTAGRRATSQASSPHAAGSGRHRTRGVVLR